MTSLAPPSVRSGAGRPACLLRRARSSAFVARSHARACALLVAPLARLLPAGLRLAPADGPRRAALRAGLEADARDRRFRRHPLPERGPAQEAGRDLLAAGRLGRCRRGARRARRAHDDRALPHPLAHRRDGDGAPDLLGRARLRRQARGVPRRGLHRRLGDPDGRGAAREDGRGARRLRGRRHGRARPRLFRARRGTASALDGADLLACGRGRRAGQGPARADVRRACRAGAVLPRALGALVPGAAARSRRAHRARAGAAVVRRDRGEERRRFLQPVGRARHARQGRHGADLSLAAARLLSPRLLRDLLARRGACRPRDSVRVEEPRPTTGSPSRSPGSCRAGSSSSSCRRSCRTMSCRSIRRSRS